MKLIIPIDRRLPEAYASYHRVIQLDPRSAAAYSGLGLVEHQLGRYQESIARYHEVRPLPFSLSFILNLFLSLSLSFFLSLTLLSLVTLAITIIQSVRVRVDVV